MSYITLREAIMPKTETEDNVLNWASQYGIVLERKGENQYKVWNGIIPNIMFYPSKLKLMFQDNGRSYVIILKDESEVVSFLMGDIDFKKPGE